MAKSEMEVIRIQFHSTDRPTVESTFFFGQEKEKKELGLN